MTKAERFGALVVFTISALILLGIGITIADVMGQGEHKTLSDWQGYLFGLIVCSGVVFWLFNALVMAAALVRWAGERG